MKSTVLFMEEREIPCLLAKSIFEDQVEQGAVNLISADLTRIPGARLLLSSRRFCNLQDRLDDLIRLFEMKKMRTLYAYHASVRRLLSQEL